MQAGEVVFSLVDIRKGTFGPNDADLLGLRAIRFVPGFAGRLTQISATLSGANVATGPATVAVAVAGVVATLPAAISFAVGQTAGATQTQPISAGGTFTALQEIRIIPGGTNTAATFAGVVLTYVRT